MYYNDRHANTFTLKVNDHLIEYILWCEAIRYRPTFA